MLEAIPFMSEAGQGNEKALDHRSGADASIAEGNIIIIPHATSVLQDLELLPSIIHWLLIMLHASNHQPGTP